MTQNPAHSRRGPSPPAVTRFQLRTASAAEAVFAAPFVGPAPRRAVAAPKFSRVPAAAEKSGRRAKAPPATAPTAPIIRRMPDALPPPPRPLELTAGTASEPRRTWHMPSPSRRQAERPERSSVPWEIEAFTTPDYDAPRSIHDPAHDSWPVAAPPGSAAPAWEDSAALEGVSGHTAQPGGDVLKPADDSLPEDTPTEAAAERFPLDAFIVPGSTARLPAGYVEEISNAVADRLEEIARAIRQQGIDALGQTRDADELARLLGALVAGYMTRGA